MLDGYQNYDLLITLACGLSVVTVVILMAVGAFLYYSRREQSDEEHPT